MKIVFILAYYLLFYLTLAFSSSNALYTEIVITIIMLFLFKDNIINQFTKIEKDILLYMNIPWIFSLVYSFVIPTVKLSIQLNLGYVLLIVLVAPIFEEFIFRYCMISMNHKVFTTILSSVLFAVAHAPDLNINILDFIRNFIYGMLFAYLYLKKNNIWYSAGAHILNNIIAVILISFNINGG